MSGEWDSLAGSDSKPIFVFSRVGWRVRGAERGIGIVSRPGYQSQPNVWIRKPIQKPNYVHPNIVRVLKKIPQTGDSLLVTEETNSMDRMLETWLPQQARWAQLLVSSNFRASYFISRLWFRLTTPEVQATALVFDNFGGAWYCVMWVMRWLSMLVGMLDTTFGLWFCGCTLLHLRGSIPGLLFP
jgi:hypothetical protein